MIKVIIIDDEPLARMLIKEYLQSWPDINISAECNDGFEGLKAITGHKPDLVFLDVQMPKVTGFEMLELLDEPPAVIFTTAFDEYAIKAFEANAIDYLLKPFSKERFDKAFNKWMSGKQGTSISSQPLLGDSENSLPVEKQRIVVKYGPNIRIIPIHKVQYIEAYDDYVKVHVGKDVFLKNKTMSFYEKTLDAKQFVRVHRSYIIRIEEIKKIEPLEKESHIVILHSGEKIPVSKAGYAKLKMTLGW